MNPADSDPDGAPAPEPPGPAPLTLIHHHPGRLRVRAPSFQEGETAARVVAALDGAHGVTAVKHTARTGSILVEYEPGVAQPEAILATIAAVSGLEMPSEDLSRGREPAVVAIDAVKELNDIVYEVLGHRTDLRTLVPAGMAVLAAYSWVKSPEARLPRWDNLVYWSYNIFSHLHRREIDERIGLAGQPGGAAAAADTVGPSEP